MLGVVVMVVVVLLLLMLVAWDSWSGMSLFLVANGLRQRLQGQTLLRRPESAEQTGIEENKRERNEEKERVERVWITRWSVLMTRSVDRVACAPCPVTMVI